MKHSTRTVGQYCKLVQSNSPIPIHLPCLPYFEVRLSYGPYTLYRLFLARLTLFLTKVPWTANQFLLNHRGLAKWFVTSRHESCSTEGSICSLRSYISRNVLSTSSCSARARVFLVDPCWSLFLISHRMNHCAHISPMIAFCHCNPVRRLRFFAF